MLLIYKFQFVTITTLSLLLASAAMAKCPDLTGQYACGPEAQKGEVIQLLTDTQGNTIFSLKAPSGMMNYVIDGKPHKIKKGQVEMTYIGSCGKNVVNISVSDPINVIVSFTQRDEDGMTVSAKYRVTQEMQAVLDQQYQIILAMGKAQSEEEMKRLKQEMTAIHDQLENMAKKITTEDELIDVPQYTYNCTRSDD